MIARRIPALLITGVLIVGTGCASSRPKAVRGVPLSSAGLESLLIRDPPAGYVQQPDSVGDTGPSDLAKAVRDDGQPDAEQALTAEGFVRGYQRLWATSSGEQIIIFLYQFRSLAGALASNRRWMAFESVAGDQSSVFTPTGFAEDNAASGLLQQQGGTTGAIVLFVDGVFAVQVEVQSTGSPSAARALVDRVAVDQRKRLS